MRGARDGTDARRGSLPLVDLQAELDSRTIAGSLFTRRGDGRLGCHACAHHCVIADGSRGACGVRRVCGDELRVPWGYIARRYVRAVETNTVFHVLPGARALTFGMYGCDLRCPYCHNANLSQALRDGSEGESPRDIDPRELVREAVAEGCDVICAAYNEPMISAEWIRAIFVEARKEELVTVIVSDGHSTPAALAFVAPVTDVFRIDLKASDAAAYRRLGGRLEPVLDTIEQAHALGLWVEVVTLVVPGLSDRPEGLSRLAGTIREIDPDIPWHLNGFVPRCRMKSVPPTDAWTLLSGAGSGFAQGVRFVYANNARGAHELAHTRCPSCHDVLVRRANYQTLSMHVEKGACSRCSEPIAGLWSRGAVERARKAVATTADA